MPRKEKRAFENSIKLKEAKTQLEQMLKDKTDPTVIFDLYKNLYDYCNNRFCGLEQEAAEQVFSASEKLSMLHIYLAADNGLITPSEEKAKEVIKKQYKTLKKVAKKYNLA